ncbi:MAG: hypothetical protein KF886_02195 [Candidatus Hydrogenedentes bacterium]|nr:hypothetical protein [Candidatus Hydrogenedentota bacterium]
MSTINTYKQKPILFCLIFLALVWSSHSVAAPLYRPERPQREINTDEYKLIVQKNNRIDILLLSGQHVLDDFYPAVQFADGARKPIQIHHRQSVRTAVRNPLGQGNGFQFRSKDGDWQIATYPTQPFLTIDFTFINHTRKPVDVARLSPLGVGKGGSLYLGGVGPIRVFCPPDGDQRFAMIAGASASSPGHLAAYNEATGQSVLAGFLHSGAGRGEVRLAASSGMAPGQFDQFAADTVFDPPVTVAPGESLPAGSVYLAITERDPQEALERFALAGRWLASEGAPEFPDTAPEISGGGETLLDWAIASRQYYAARGGSPAIAAWLGDLEKLSPRFNDNQFITAMTLAAVQGADLEPAASTGGLSAVRRHVLSRLAPPAAGGRPRDLFQEAPPGQWVLPVDGAAGKWTIAALFNWDADRSVETDIPLPRLGLNGENYYTIYDYWAGQYLGVIQGRLRAEIPAEGVRLFGLRLFEKRPLLVAGGGHFTQGARDHTSLSWSYEGRVLAGEFQGAPGKPYTLTVLIPEPYVFAELNSEPAAEEHAVSGAVLTFTVRPDAGGRAAWRVKCGVSGTAYTPAP